MNKYNEIIYIGNPLLRLVAIPISDDEFGSSELYNIADIFLDKVDDTQTLGFHDELIKVGIYQPRVC